MSGAPREAAGGLRCRGLLSAAARQRAPPAAAGRARAHTLLQLLAACAPGACAAACVVFGVSARWPCSPHCPPLLSLPQPPHRRQQPGLPHRQGRARHLAARRELSAHSCADRGACVRSNEAMAAAAAAVRWPRRAASRLGGPTPTVCSVSPLSFSPWVQRLSGAARAHAARLATVFRPTQAPARRCGPPGRTLRSALPQNTFEPFAPSLSLPQSLCGT